MSSERSLTPEPVGMGANERKFWLRVARITQEDIARKTGVTQALVNNVINGENWTGSKGRIVMEHVAERLGYDINVVFPFADRRKRDKAA